MEYVVAREKGKFMSPVVYKERGEGTGFQSGGGRATSALKKKAKEVFSLILAEKEKKYATTKNKGHVPGSF